MDDHQVTQDEARKREFLRKLAELQRKKNQIQQD